MAERFLERELREEVVVAVEVFAAITVRVTGIVFGESLKFPEIMMFVVYVPGVAATVAGSR